MEGVSGRGGMSFEYHRPKTIEEALELLDVGVPMAGGTAVTPARSGLEAVIDLQDLGLDGFRTTGEGYEFGAALPLQTLVESAETLLSALVHCCRLEAGWNIRNKATVAGTIVSCDGRSPLVTTLLAMGAEVELARAGDLMPLDAYLDTNAKGDLITAIHVPRQERLLYEQVARAPFDRPQVCVAVARSETVRVSLGGFGARPILVDGDGLDEWVRNAEQAYVEADDAWASGEYRSSIAGVLTNRLVGEMLAE
jgi:CO/xanthine dehydrogenase FAD-binding subunit